MNNFIKATNAITGNDMLIRLDSIATVEESFRTSTGVIKSVSKITFVNNKPDEYAEEPLTYFEALL